MDNTATTTTPDNVDQIRAWVLEAVQLDKDWRDCGMPDTVSIYDAHALCDDFDARYDGRWIYGTMRYIDRYHLAYHIVSNRD